MTSLARRRALVSWILFASAIAVISTLLWIRSAWYVDEVNLSLGSRTYRLISEPQRFMFLTVRRLSPGQAPYGGLGDAHAIPLSWSQLWFEYSSRGPTTWWLAIPYWTVLVAAVIALVFPVRKLTCRSQEAVESDDHFADC